MSSSGPGLVAIQRRLRAFVMRAYTLWWRLRVRFGPAVRLGRPEELTVILMSYSRPRNIDPIVRAALKCRFVRRVRVQNNNPEIDIRDWVDVDDPRLVITNSEVRRWAGVRWDLARETNDPFFLAIDDDVFLFPGQIASLFMHLLRDPSVPHGVHGVRWTRTESRRHADEIAHRAGEETTVDVLHQLYAVTSRHVIRQKRLLEDVRAMSDHAYDISQRFGDDVVISYCGDGSPRVHDLGPVATCPTSHADGIALNQLDGFFRDRRLLLDTILDSQARGAQRPVALARFAPTVSVAGSRR